RSKSSIAGSVYQLAGIVEARARSGVYSKPVKSMPQATILAMDRLLAWRDEFPILANTTYMISHSLGAMPKRAVARMNEFTETWATRGIRAWEEGWWEMPIAVGN